MTGDAGLRAIADEAAVLGAAMLETAAVVLGLVVLFGIVGALTSRRGAEGTRRDAAARWIAIGALSLVPLLFPAIYGWAQGMSPFLFLLAACVSLHHSAAPGSRRARALVVVGAYAMLLCTAVQGARLDDVARTTAPDLWAEVMLFDLAYKLSLPQLWLLERLGAATSLKLYEELLSVVVRRCAEDLALLLALGCLIVAQAAFGGPVAWGSARGARRPAQPGGLALAVLGLAVTLATPALAEVSSAGPERVGLAWQLTAPVVAGQALAAAALARAPLTTSRALLIFSAGAAAGALGLLVIGAEPFLAGQLALVALATPLWVGLHVVAAASPRRWRAPGIVALVALFALSRWSLFAVAAVGLLALLLGVGARPAADAPSPPSIPTRRALRWSALAPVVLCVWGGLVLWCGATLSVPAAARERAWRDVAIDRGAPGESPAAAARARCEARGLRLCRAEDVVALRRPRPERGPRLRVLADVVGARCAVIAYEQGWLLPWPPSEVPTPRQIVLPPGTSAREVMELEHEVSAACCP